MKRQFTLFLSILLAISLVFTSCGAAAPSEGGAPAEPSQSASQPAEAGEPEEPAAPEAPVYVYLTRHGETITNRTARMVSGRGNTPLTAEGREVASTVGVGLSGVKFAAAYASPLGRTQETARLILAQSQTSWDLPIQPMDGLREMDGGSFEPMGYGELMKDKGFVFDGVNVQEFQDQFAEKDPTGEAETYDETGARAMAALGESLKDVEFSSVHTSDQFKDADTADLIVDGTKNPDLMAHRRSDLRGVVCGYFDGELEAVTQQIAPAGASARERIDAYAAADPMKMVEPYDEARARLTGALDDVCKTQRELGGGNVLIVTSELACQLLAEEYGAALDQPLEPGSVVRLTYDGTGYQPAQE